MGKRIDPLHLCLTDLNGMAKPVSHRHCHHQQKRPAEKREEASSRRGEARKPLSPLPAKALQTKRVKALRSPLKRVRRRLARRRRQHTAHGTGRQPTLEPISDSKKLGRIDGIGHRITGDRRGQSSRRGRGEGLGWEALHVAIDDASRLAYTEILPDEKKTSATAFPARALGFFERHGIKVERVMTDNGSAYKSWLFRKALADRGIRHKRTRPCTPRTNGKAERFIQTSLRELLYARPFHSSAQRTEAMPAWLCDYNTRRPHAALGGKPPISKLKDDVLGNDSYPGRSSTRGPATV